MRYDQMKMPYRIGSTLAMDSGTDAPLGDFVSPPMYDPTATDPDTVLITTLPEPPINPPTVAPAGSITDFVQSNPLLTAGLLFGGLYLFGAFKKKRRK
jgi:hypothetical protein